MCAMKDHSTDPISEARAVLILEDSHVILDYFALLVSRAGYEAVKTSTVRDALEYVSDPECIKRLRLAILDIEIYDALSFPVYERIRRMRSDLPVLFVSGGFFFEELSAIIAADPAVSFLQKPASGADIQKVLSDPLVWGGDVSRLLDPSRESN